MWFRLYLDITGKEQEAAALRAGFATAVHYELAGGLMGCLVATT